MTDYDLVEFIPGETIKHAVETLQGLIGQGILAKGDFNGHTLYSDTVTLDGAYKLITGKSYAQCLADEKERLENYNKREQEYKNSLPEKVKQWIKKGEIILDAEFVEEWNKIVSIRASDLYHGMELDASLEIIKSLNGGEPFEKGRDIIESQDHSGMSYSLVCSMVRNFCKRGASFVARCNFEIKLMNKKIIL